jgi:hypothetical protein
MRKSFYHELLQPYQTLVFRASRNDLVGGGTSDITAAARALAVAAAHFLEARSLQSCEGREEDLRLMLRDVADSAKHGQLRAADRTVTLSVGLAYEVDDIGRARFLRTEVTACNKKYGSFDLIETIGHYIRALHDRFNFQFQRVEPLIEPKPFGAEASAIVTDNTAEVGSVNIRTYKRDASGALVLADPVSFFFVVR